MTSEIGKGHSINIGMLLTWHAKYRPNHTAVIFKEERLNYREYNQNVNSVANMLLDLGITKGDKVATVLPNCLELLETYWAVAKIGALVVPLSPLLLKDGLKSLLLDSDSKMVLTNSNFIKIFDELKDDLINIASENYLLIDTELPGYQNYHKLKDSASILEPEGIEITENDPFNIIYSSGTTGLPKGIVHSHYVRLMYGMEFSSVFRIKPESIIIHTGSIVFNGSFVTLMPAIFLGATYILSPSFDPDVFIETVFREKATHIIMVPTQIIAFLHSPKFSAEKLKSLEMICTVGSPFHKEHKEELNRKLPGKFYELYGVTEGFLTVLDKYDYAKKPSSVGATPRFFDMRIVNDSKEDVEIGEIGEIIGRGPMLMTEYYKRPDLTQQTIIDGWLYTGDLGYMDEEGFLYLVDRKKDMIKSGGISVFPRDIEEVIVQHPAVREAAVFGVSDEKWVETPVAAVILKEKNTISSEELQNWINEHVSAKYQRVSKVIIMEDFPRNIAGKILKRVMRDEYSKLNDSE